MPPLTAPFLAACALVAVAGVLKLRRPADTAQALRTQGLPSGRAAVRALGAAEVVVAVLALTGTAAGAAALAVLYAGFTGFVLLALVRRRPLSSCGCFGRPDTPPSVVHVVVTTAGALCAAAAALTGGAGLPALADASTGQAVAAAWGALLVGGLTWAALAELPPVLAAAARRPEPEEPAHPALFSITSRSTAS